MKVYVAILTTGELVTRLETPEQDGTWVELDVPAPGSNEQIIMSEANVKGLARLYEVQRTLLNRADDRKLDADANRLSTNDDAPV